MMSKAFLRSRKKHTPNFFSPRDFEMDVINRAAAWVVLLPCLNPYCASDNKLKRFTKEINLFNVNSSKTLEKNWKG